MMHYIRYYYHTCITTSWLAGFNMCRYVHIYMYYFVLFRCAEMGWSGMVWLISVSFYFSSSLLVHIAKLLLLLLCHRLPFVHYC